MTDNFSILDAWSDRIDEIMTQEPITNFCRNETAVPDCELFPLIASEYLDSDVWLQT